MTPREIEEYSALRATIRERGTARIILFVFGLVAWSALTVTLAVAWAVPLATLLPLMVLTAVFEGVFALHIGVERIGRYVQVFFEQDPDAAGWERRIAEFARPFEPGEPDSRPGGPARPTQLDALFTVPFCAAAVLNLIPAVAAEAVTSEWVALGAVHLVFVVRVLAAGRQAARQRTVDSERFAAVKRRETAGLEAATSRPAR